MRAFPVIMILIATAIFVSLIPTPAAALPSPYTWHVQDTSGNPIKKATVDIQNHSAQMTDADGNVVFNWEVEDFPLTVSASAFNYDDSGPITFDDPYTNVMTITLTGNGTPAVCGGVIMACAAMLCMCLIVMRRRGGEDVEETR